MAQPYSIASVTVAYNGAGVLRRHLDSLKRQSRTLDEIIVVNNSPGDDTHDLLTAEYPEVTVMNMPENGGVGGGFAAGIAYAALEKKYDWVWLFDQDSVPAKNGLETLLAGFEQLDDIARRSTAILSPMCVNSATGTAYPGLIWRGGWREIPIGKDSPTVLWMDSVISSGTLLKHDTVEGVGLPRADFFMDYVDHEYCFRVRRAGYAIAMIPASRLAHEIGNVRPLKFLGLRKRWADHDPWREYYMVRNELFTVWKYHPDWKSKWSTLNRLFRHMFDLLLFAQKKWACFRMIVRGVKDGFAGKLGIREFDTDQAAKRSKLNPTLGEGVQP